jgi:hypothetical protein
MLAASVRMMGLDGVIGLSLARDSCLQIGQGMRRISFWPSEHGNQQVMTFIQE